MKTFLAIVSFYKKRQDPAHGPYSKEDLFCTVFHALDEEIYYSNLFDDGLPF